MTDTPKWLAKLKDDPIYIAKAGRKTYHIDFTESGFYGSNRVEAPIEKANCYSSESRLIPEMHLPCFDIDLPRFAPAPQMGLLTVEDLVARYTRLMIGDQPTDIRWVPSSTADHFHVYIDYAVEWLPYLNMLALLTAAMVIEQGYYEASQAGGATFVRLPGVKREKPRPEWHPLERKRTRFLPGPGTSASAMFVRPDSPKAWE